MAGFAQEHLQLDDTEEKRKPGCSPPRGRHERTGPAKPARLSDPVSTGNLGSPYQTPVHWLAMLLQVARPAGCPTNTSRSIGRFAQGSGSCRNQGAAVVGIPPVLPSFRFLKTVGYSRLQAID